MSETVQTKMRIRKTKFILPFGTTLYLPDGVNLRDFSFEPDDEEKASEFEKRRRQNRLAKLQRLEVLWAAQDAERLRRRAAELEIIVAADRLYVERATAVEQEEARVTNYWLEERKKTADAEMKSLLARLERATDSINKD